MHMFLLLLPIAWVVVASAVGVFLYRSSQAVFEEWSRQQSSTGAQGGRRIRFVGSVVIAGAAFFALRHATPDQLLHVLPEGQVAVNARDLETLTNEAREIDRVALEVLACGTAFDNGCCVAKAMSLRDVSVPHSAHMSSLIGVLH